jgi:hypothetical protein
VRLDVVGVDLRLHRPTILDPMERRLFAAPRMVAR